MSETTHGERGEFALTLGLHVVFSWRLSRWGIAIFFCHQRNHKMSGLLASLTITKLPTSSRFRPILQVKMVLSAFTALDEFSRPFYDLTKDRQVFGGRAAII